MNETLQVFEALNFKQFQCNLSYPFQGKNNKTKPPTKVRYQNFKQYWPQELPLLVHLRAMEAFFVEAVKFKHVLGYSSSSVARNSREVITALLCVRLHLGIVSLSGPSVQERLTKWGKPGRRAQNQPGARSTLC